MTNTTTTDRGGDQRDPFELFSVNAAEMSGGTGAAAEGSDDVRADADPHTTEEAAKETMWRALCASAGLPASGSDRVMWRLHTLGALESATIWHHERGFFAPFAWPEEHVALMLANPLSEWDRLPAEDIADNAFFDSARNAVFQQSGWIVLQVDPTCSTLDEQLGHIVDRLLGGTADEDVES